MALVEAFDLTGNNEASMRAEKLLLGIDGVLLTQQQRPPIDSYLGAFYEELHGRLSDNTPTRKFLREIFEQRDMPVGAAVNLIPRAYQYTVLNTDENDGNYPHGHDTASRWASTMDSIETDADKRELLKKTLLEKNTITTVYSRFAGPRAVVNLVFPNQAVKIGDFGCGSNQALKGTAAGMPLYESPNEPQYEGIGRDTLSKLIHTPPLLEYGVGVDLADPNDPEVKAWREACQYPSKLTPEHLQRYREFEERMAAVSNVDFIQGDLKDPTLLERMPKLHAVNLSTICYQMPAEEQKQIFENVSKVLLPGGIIIIQDFAHAVPVTSVEEGNPLGLRFEDDWGPWTYSTFVLAPETSYKPALILQWETGRTKTVRMGEDFPEFAKAVKKSYKHGRRRTTDMRVIT